MVDDLRGATRDEHVSAFEVVRHGGLGLVTCALGQERCDLDSAFDGKTRVSTIQTVVGVVAGQSNGAKVEVGLLLVVTSTPPPVRLPNLG